MKTDEWLATRRACLTRAGILYFLVVSLLTLCTFSLQAQPAHNNFSNATILSGISGTHSSHNTGASKEPGEPDHAGNWGGASVWFRWTAPTNSIVNIDTHGSSFDTLLAVYGGNSLSTLTEVTSDDDSGGGYTSAVSFVAGAGMAYWIAVDGYYGSQGNISMNWSATP
jgi:hypothetical protein